MRDGTGRSDWRTCRLFSSYIMQIKDGDSKVEGPVRLIAGRGREGMICHF